MFTCKAFPGRLHNALLSRRRAPVFFLRNMESTVHRLFFDFRVFAERAACLSLSGGCSLLGVQGMKTKGTKLSKNSKISGDLVSLTFLQVFLEVYLIPALKL